MKPNHDQIDLATSQVSDESIATLSDIRIIDEDHDIIFDVDIDLFPEDDELLDPDFDKSWLKHFE